MSSKRITKLCTNLHPAPSTTTQLISTSTQLSATPSIIFEPKHCTNWVISPNLGRKTKCPFWLKIGTLDIVEVMILNPELDFWNFDPKIKFWINLDPNIQSCPFCLKIGTQNISRMLISKPDLDFWNVYIKVHFGANLGPKSQSCLLCLKIGTHGISRILILILILVFSNFKPESWGCWFLSWN